MTAATPGQAAYEAWVATVFGYRHTPEWHKLEARDHAGWEAAAAAIAAQDARPAPELAARLDRLATTFDAEAMVTHPSKASEIKRDVAWRIRQLLEGE